MTQGFLEFTVEDYLATGQIEGRYEIQVNQLDPRVRLAHCDKDCDSHPQPCPAHGPRDGQGTL